MKPATLICARVQVGPDTHYRVIEWQGGIALEVVSVPDVASVIIALPEEGGSEATDRLMIAVSELRHEVQERSRSAYTEGLAGVPAVVREAGGGQPESLPAYTWTGNCGDPNACDLLLGIPSESKCPVLELCRARYRAMGGTR